MSTFKTNKFEAIAHLKTLSYLVDSEEDIEAIDYLREFIEER